MNIVSGLCFACSEDRRLGRARAPDPSATPAIDLVSDGEGTDDNRRPYNAGGWFYTDEDAFRNTVGLDAQNIEATEKCYICHEPSNKGRAFDLGGEAHVAVVAS